MNYVPKPLFEGYTHNGQYVRIEQVRLLHNNRAAVTITVNRNTLELDQITDARVISGIGHALLAMAQREQVA